MALPFPVEADTAQNSNDRRIHWVKHSICYESATVKLFIHSKFMRLPTLTKDEEDRIQVFTHRKVSELTTANPSTVVDTVLQAFSTGKHKAELCDLLDPLLGSKTDRIVDDILWESERSFSKRSRSNSRQRRAPPRRRRSRSRSPRRRERSSPWDQRKPKTKSKNTLRVTDIPPFLQSIEKLYPHFIEFGTLLNIDIQSSKRTAFIRYADESNALDAVRSAKAVCGNRFIKVFYADFDLEASEDSDFSVGRTIKPMPRSLTKMVKDGMEEKRQVIMNRLKQNEEMLESVKGMSDSARDEMMRKLEGIKVNLEEQLKVLTKTPSIKSPMRLDNRSTSLLVKGIPRNLMAPQALKSHFQSFGSIENVEIRDDGAIVQFSTPSMAVKAKKHGQYLLGHALDISYP